LVQSGPLIQTGTGKSGRSLESLAFAKECADECAKYTDLLEASPLLGKAQRPVQSLLRDLDAQAALPILLSAYVCLDADRFAEVARWVLVFVMRYSVMANQDSSGLENVLFQLARRIRTDSVTPDGKPEPSKFGKCVGAVRQTLEQASPTLERVLAVDDLILSPDEARYVVDRVARFMQTKTKEIAIGDVNIEHVFPKRPSVEWTNAKELEPMLWHLGNLTALGTRINQKTGNNGFAVKRTHYAQKTELDMPQEIARDFTDWTPATIRDRARRLASVMVKVWSFENTSFV
nr:HNH endonuclease family protein [Phycisphaerales bacterium]